MGTEDSPSTAPMKPQETVIFLLGELKGSVTALQTSVDNSAQAQAQINKQNEADHDKFRTDIAGLNTSVAVLNDNRTSQRYSMSERTQKWMVYAGIPSVGVSVVTLFFMFYNK
jgi:hypothetical protein